MGFDLLGQLFGKNKRRQMEAQVAGRARPVQVALPILGSRLAAVGLASILGTALKGGIPHDAQSAAAVGSAALGAVILAAPDAFRASGILRAVSPQTASLAQVVGQAVSTLASAPKAQRNQEIQTIATQAALAAVEQWQNKTGQYTPDQLASKVLTPDQLAGQSPLPAGFAVTDLPETMNPSETATPASAPVLTAFAPIVTAKEQK